VKFIICLRNVKNIQMYFRVTKKIFYFLNDLIQATKTRNTKFREAISREDKFSTKKNIKCMYLRLGNFIYNEWRT